MGLKPPDCWTVPLCGGDGCHHEQHEIGHKAFDAKHGVSLKAKAEYFASVSPAFKKV